MARAGTAHNRWGGRPMWSAAGLLSRTALWRDGTDRRAMRVYRYSITYLSASFAFARRGGPGLPLRVICRPRRGALSAAILALLLVGCAGAEAQIQTVEGFCSRRWATRRPTSRPSRCGRTGERRCAYRSAPGMTGMAASSLAPQGAPSPGRADPRHLSSGRRAQRGPASGGRRIARRRAPGERRSVGTLAQRAE